MTHASRRALLLSLLGMTVLLPSCAPRRAAQRAFDQSGETLMVTVDAVRAAKAPFALQGRFSVRLESPGASGTVQGALILHQPDRFRIELLTPFGTPLFYVASDGRALNAWAQRDGIYYQGDDARRVLDELTGGAVALSDVNALLTGLLPLPDAPIIGLSEDDDGMVQVVLQAPDRVRVLAVLDPKEELTRELRVVRVDSESTLPITDEAVPKGETLVEVRYLESMRVGRTRLPEDVVVSLPTLGWTLELAFQSWDELGQIPEVFDLPPPPGATVMDLVETLQALAEQRGAAADQEAVERGEPAVQPGTGGGGRPPGLPLTPAGRPAR